MAMKYKIADVKRNSSVPAQGQQWTDYLSCVACEKEFNRTNRCPISLVCGHTVCRSCLGKYKHGQCNVVPDKMTCDVTHLPVNSALLQLVPADAAQKDSYMPSVTALQQTLQSDPQNFGLCVKHYENAKADIEELALYLKPSKTSELSRPMQRKLIALVNCQLVEEEGRKRAIRAGRALGERAATELILLHQNPSTLSASLWTAVRGRGCQFLGPAMQEEALKLIHLALDDGSELSRKVLVQLVVNSLETQFSQASKTSVGHVVQLLYRASCFNVTKREGDSSLMRLKDEFLVYEELRKEHDTQIVQIAREAGLRIAPDQWSALLYGDQVHKSYMQSIIDKLQSGVTFTQCIQDLSLAIQRSFDPGNIRAILPYFKFLSGIDVEHPAPDWALLAQCMHAAKTVVQELINFTKKHHHSMWQNQDANQQSSKYKTSLCRDFKSKGNCPRGNACTFAHSERELQIHRNRRKKGGQAAYMPGNFTDGLGRRSESDFSGSVAATNVISQAAIIQNQNCQCSGFVQNYSASPPPNLMYSSNHTACPKSASGSVVSSHTVANILPAEPAPLKVSSTKQLISAQGSQQSLSLQNVAPQPNQQIQYVPVNHALYSAKQYEPIAPPMDHTGHFVGNVPQPGIHVISDPHSSPQNQSLPPAIVQQNHYMVPPQHHPPNYYSIPPSQMQAVVSPQHRYVRTPYVPLPNVQPPIPVAAPQTLERNAQPQVLVQPPQPSIAIRATHNPELLPQTQFLIQSPQQSATVPPAQPGLAVAMAQQDMAVPVAPRTHNVVRVPQMVPREYVVNNADFVSTAIVSPLVPIASVNRTKSSSPILTDSCSLEELRQRKYEVISKLVQKRIVAPKVVGIPQQHFGSYPSLNVTKEAQDPHSKQWSPSHSSTNDKIAVTTNQPQSLLVTVPCINSVMSVSTQNKAAHSGYSLWSGTTCIPSINELTIHAPNRDGLNQTIPTIDVISDLDTSTSHVPASTWYTSDIYTSNRSTSFVSSSVAAAHLHFADLISVDDDFYPIQDQRIVSKYGPIARNVRSKLTSALPEQVTANGAGQTHSFPSDKDRDKSHFVVNYNAEEQNVPHVCTEVEPTVVESVVCSHRILPDIITTNTQNDGRLDCVAHDMGIVQSEIQDEEEDLRLAIELQRIEMGIQQKLQKRSL